MDAVGTDYNPADVKAVDLTPFATLREYAIATLKDMIDLSQVEDSITLYFSFFVTQPGLGSDLYLRYTPPYRFPNTDHVEPAEFYFVKARLDMHY